MNISGKKITIVGCGKSGQAAARLAHQHQAVVRVLEGRLADEVDVDFLAWVKENSLAAEYGGHTQEFIQASDVVILSPGVRPDAPVWQWAEQKGIPVWSEIELAGRFCPCPVIAVTGSNGKTTVATLIHQVLQAAGKKAYLCGNIGWPFCACVPELTASDIVVVEVSSFQLQTVDQFKPHVAVFLNFSQNHLDWHRDLPEYLAAKKRIFSNQGKEDCAVLNSADEAVCNLASELTAQVLFFNAPGDAEKYQINDPNFLAVMAAVQAVGVGEDVAREVFESFKGVEHRLEKVRVLDGVEFVNDAKATTVRAGRWALEHMDKPTLMLCGGRDKNMDFSVLRDCVGQRVKKMVVFGEAKDKLWETFASVVEVGVCEDLYAAVACARQEAEAGDCVLLSPMCASFDQFVNFEERGKVFKDIVNRLE